LYFAGTFNFIIFFYLFLSQTLGADYNMTQSEIFAFVWVSGATRVLTFTMNKQRHQRYVRKMDMDQAGENEMSVYPSLFFNFLNELLFFKRIFKYFL
jgi:hypothetical protein